VFVRRYSERRVIEEESLIRVMSVRVLDPNFTFFKILVCLNLKPTYLSKSSILSSFLYAFISICNSAKRIWFLVQIRSQHANIRVVKAWMRK